MIPDFNQVQPNQVIPQPIYANLQEFKQEQTAIPEKLVAMRQSTAIGRQRARRPLSFASSEDTSSLLSMALDACGGGGGGGVIRDDDEGKHSHHCLCMEMGFLEVLSCVCVYCSFWFSFLFSVQTL